VLKSFPDVARHAEVADALTDRFIHGSIPELLGLLYRVFNDNVYTLHSLLLEERRRLLGVLINGIVGRYDPIYRSLVEENRRLIQMIKDINMPVPEVFRLALQYVLSRDLNLSLAGLPEDSAARTLASLRDDADRFGLPLDWDQAARVLTQLLEDEMRPLFDGFSSSRIKRLVDLLRLSERLRLPMNLWRLENMFFDLSKTSFRALSDEDRSLAASLGGKLRFPPDAVAGSPSN
jgi:hypothetical protein